MGLSEEIREAIVPDGMVSIWWLGQASFVLRTNDQTIYIDPFLSEFEGRLIPPPFSPEEAPPASAVLITHDHIDHLDPETIPGLIKNSPESKFLVPNPISSQLLDIGVPSEQIIGVQPEDNVSLGSIAVHVTPAMHGESFPPYAYTFGDPQEGYRFVGYVLEYGDTRIYHAGDTIIFDGLADMLRKLNVDVGLLPINGRNYFREKNNLVGNMDEREAVELAAEAHISTIIPMHYDMFEPNLGRPDALISYLQRFHPEITCVFLARFQRFNYFKSPQKLPEVQ